MLHPVLIQAEQAIRDSLADFLREIADAETTTEALALYERLQAVWQAVDQVETLAYRRAQFLNGATA